MENSQIQKLIQDAAQGSSGLIHIHISHILWERNIGKRAKKLFYYFNLQRAPKKNGFLIYLNLRYKKFALVTDKGFTDKVGQKFLDNLAKTFKDDLLSTHHENSLILILQVLNITYKKHFSKGH